ncbi:hypothetical protein SAMD00079811_69220 [Scytonema sp. HK-05]|uniref:hypothetical protein n=1 Tax=Scytonema sp. HK-05 TaxID=1137095 RepID=UPI00093662BE|nr:hypothetical protein [Scytonema sp. HK-05]OKH58447.1 hypothetical protein NIES2130_14270 [Scytonema sp. HK-05]BAY49293.1 hypothetical protein SAMD00079811_69220 [Scytonema sp. HK-05]
MNAVSSVELKRPIWQSIAMLTLGFWLSASLLLDWVIMPSLYVSGMMTQASFASAGYVIFWNFNRLELLSAGLVLTSVLALCNSQSKWRRSAIILSMLLLAIALVDTYLLTPQMSAIGLELNLFQTIETPAAMNVLHGGYWVLEVVKLLAGGTLLGWCWRR